MGITRKHYKGSMRREMLDEQLLKNHSLRLQNSLLEEKLKEVKIKGSK